MEVVQSSGYASSAESSFDAAVATGDKIASPEARKETAVFPATCAQLHGCGPTLWPTNASERYEPAMPRVASAEEVGAAPALRARGALARTILAGSKGASKREC